MKIQDALKETGKAEVISTEKVYTYAKLNKEGSLFWYDKITHEQDVAVAVSVIGKDIWQPYHEEKEIRPRNAGELWEKNNLRFAIVRDRSNNKLMLRCCEDDYLWSIANQDFAPIIHNKNGWTLLYSPDKEIEDKNIERIEIEGIEWDSFQLIGYEQHATIPFIRGKETGFGKHLINKPPMKMILEIPKE